MPIIINGSEIKGIVYNGVVCPMYLNGQLITPSEEQPITPIMGSVTIADRSYTTVTFGKQEWLCSNLAYKFTGLTIKNTNEGCTEVAGWYYNNNTSYQNLYGIMYNWYALKYLNDNRETLLPEGWRVPQKTDYEELFNILNYDISDGAKPFKSTDTWQGEKGTNEYKLNILPAGVMNFAGFKYLKLQTMLSTITKDDDYNNYCLSIGGEYQSDANRMWITNTQMSWGCYVRLIRDVL